MAEITLPEQVRANSSAGHLAVHLEGAHPVDVPFLFEQPEKRLVPAFAGSFGSHLVMALLAFPAMVLGGVGYFLARSSKGRIAESGGTIGGLGTATAGLALGIATTAVGAVITLFALVMYLLAAFGQPPV